MGAVPKFKCKLPSGQTLRIKYGGDTRVSREVFAEVAATRLLWALGFLCRRRLSGEDPLSRMSGKKPLAPIHERKESGTDHRSRDHGARVSRVFIEKYPDQGWKWSELDEVDQSLGGATRTQIDALKLLAVFIQHSDNKPDQQRLAAIEKI